MKSKDTQSWKLGKFMHKCSTPSISGIKGHGRRIRRPCCLSQSTPCDRVTWSAVAVAFVFAQTNAFQNSLLRSRRGMAKATEKASGKPKSKGRDRRRSRSSCSLSLSRPGQRKEAHAPFPAGVRAAAGLGRVFRTPTVELCSRWLCCTKIVGSLSLSLSLFLSHVGGPGSVQP